MRYSPVVGEVVIPTGETEELTTYLRDQWHLLVRADNLLGPRHALGGVLSQLDIMTAVRRIHPTARRSIRVGP